MILTESCHDNRTGHFRYLIHHSTAQSNSPDGRQVINSFGASSGSTEISDPFSQASEDGSSN